MTTNKLYVEDFLFKKYRNIKTEKTYYVSDHCVNTTNDRDGKIMLLYYAVLSPNTLENKKLFCRELKEFNQKFKL